MSREREEFDEIGKKLKTADEIDGCNNYYINMGRRHMIMLQGGSSSSTTSTTAVGGGMILNTITPCAACKLLRRRCAEECPFSPYFSPHEPHKFAAVHKVFGASNVSKMLMEVAEPQRADAANSLVYEANVRLRDPVYGCMGAISALQQQVQTLQAELNAVRAEILRYKYREAAANSIIASSLAVSVAEMPQAPPTPTPSPPALAVAPPPRPPPPPPPVPPSIVVSSTSSTPSTMYTSPSSTTSYSSISNNHLPYFD